MDELKNYSINQLFDLYDDVMEALRKKDVIRSSNNPVADYAEWLVAKALNLELQPKSCKGCDAKGIDGLKYQVKARRTNATRGSKQLGAIRNIEAHNFDFVIVVFFCRKFTVKHAYKIPYATIHEHAKYKEYQNAHILRVSPTLLADPDVIDISELIQAATVAHSELAQGMGPKSS